MHVQVMDNLFVGDAKDVKLFKGQPKTFVIHACKEPYHRDALGYTGKAAPRNNREYLIARREGCMILNLVDPDTVKYIPQEIMDAAITEIGTQLSLGNRVYIHCNEGKSRAPTIALLYMAGNTNILRTPSLGEAVSDFMKIHEAYNPSKGMMEYLFDNWSRYVNHEKESQ